MEAAELIRWPDVAPMLGITRRQVLDLVAGGVLAHQPGPDPERPDFYVDRNAVERLVIRRNAMALPTPALWRHFVDTANPGALHPHDRDRLYEFVARACAAGDAFDLPKMRSDMTAANFTEEVQSEVIDLLEVAPKLLEWYDRVRGE